MKIRLLTTTLSEKRIECKESFGLVMSTIAPSEGNSISKLSLGNRKKIVFH